MSSDTEVSVGITADDSGLVTGFAHASQVVESGSHDMQESLEAVKETFSELAGLFGVGLGLEGIKSAVEAIAELEKQALETSESIVNLTQTLGVSIPTIQTVAYAAGLVGGNMDTATTALTRLSRAAAEANAGNEKLAADFQAIGISSEELGRLLQNPDELLKTVTEHLAEFGDGANKTAIEMSLMGRGAGAMAPLINELGENWKGLNEEALKFAGATDTDILALANAQREINKTNQELGGLRMQFAVALLPAVESATAQINEFAESAGTKSAIREIGDLVKYVTDNFTHLREVALTGGLGAAIAEVFANGTQAGLNFGNTIRMGWAAIERDGAIAWANIKQYIADALTYVEKYALKAEALSALASGQVGVYRQLMEASESLAKADTGQASAVEKANDAYNAYVAGLRVTAGAQDQTRTVIETMTVTAEKLGDKVLKLPDAMKGTADAADEAARGLDKLQQIADKLAGDAGSAYDKAFAQYEERMHAITQAFNEATQGGRNLAEAQELQRQASESASDAYHKQVDNINALTDANKQLDDAFAKQVDSLKGATLEQDIEKQYLTDLAIAEKAWRLAGEDVDQMLATHGEELHRLAASQVDYLNRVKQTREELRQWQQIATQALDSTFQTLNKDLIEGGNLMSDLKNIAKQTVEAILMQFERLLVINPLLNSIFGLSGSSALPSAGLGDIFNNIGSLFGFGGGAAGGAGGAGAAGGIGPGTWLDAGKQLGGSFTDSISSWVRTTFGIGATDLGGAGVLASGATGAFEGSAAAIAGETSPWMTEGGVAAYGSAIADATPAATSSVLDSLGGFSGVASIFGAAMTGYQLGGVGGAAALAVAAYFIPVVGWIAGIASLVNSLTGGGLFGTSWKPTGASESTLSIDSSGASVDNQFEESKKKALFGGTKTKWKDQGPTADQTSAANAFFGQEQDAVNAFAQSLGQAAGEVISGTYTTSTDKHGNVTTSDTVLGQTYKGETSQQFGERIAADSAVAVMDKLGIAASAFVAGVQGDADKLAEKTQELASVAQQAYADISKGASLLGSDKNLADVVNEVIKLQGANEKLSDTYMRLEAESKDFTLDIEHLGITTDKTGAAFVEFADDAAKAAGGIQNLDKLTQQFISDYYTSAEQTQMHITDLANASKGSLAAIGLGPNTSMADFKKAFDAIKDSLSADDLVKWEQAGVDLANFTQAVLSVAQAAAEATAKYEAFVGQFAPQVHYVDAYQAGLARINAQMVQNIREADALAKAAGMSGASQEDLGRIQAQAAQQAAALAQQLEAGAQQLAFSLGLTTTGSLDQVNQEIAKLEGQADTGAQAVQNFGSAMHSAADAAKKAIDLLIGDLSPLSDQQKLQDALQGLRAGTVTAEQVLTIGRRLYASSEAYNDLFNEVERIHPATAGSSGGGGSGGHAGGGLSSADAARLKELLKEQQALQAAQQTAQYQTLAQNIADIATTKGEGVLDVIKDMGINLKDFEKGLGVTSDEALQTYIQNLQTQTDSAGQNTQDIVSAIEGLPAAIAEALGVGAVPTRAAPPVPVTHGAGLGGSGEPVGFGGRGAGTGPVAPPNRGGEPQPGAAPQPPPTADQIGQAVAYHVSRIVNPRQYRSERVV